MRVNGTCVDKDHREMSAAVNIKSVTASSITADCGSGGYARNIDFDWEVIEYN